MFCDPQDFQVKLPAGINCQGKVDGVDGNVCLMKIANTNKAGPFGDLHFIQVGGAAGGNGTAAAAPAKAAAASTASTKATKGNKADKSGNKRNAVDFEA